MGQHTLTDEEENAHLQKTFSSPDGRLAISILKGWYYDVESFNSDPLEMARIGGQRQVIDELIDLQEGG